MNAKLATIENDQVSSKLFARALNITLWLVQIGIAAMFLVAGINKVSGDPQMVGLFQTIGFGQWFRYLTGSLELAGAVLLFVPRFAGVGAALLAGVMLGAVATLLFVIGGNPTTAIVLLAANVFVTWARRHEVLNLIRR